MKSKTQKTENFQILLVFCFSTLCYDDSTLKSPIQDDYEYDIHNFYGKGLVKE